MKSICPQRDSAFSLVEVALAIGIVAFAMISLLGLFSVGFQSSQRSAESTILPLLAEQIKGEEAGTNATAVGTTRTTYFTLAGDPATPGDFHYKCVIKALSADQGVLPGVSDHFVPLVVTVVAPDWERTIQLSRFR